MRKFRKKLQKGVCAVTLAALCVALIAPATVLAEELEEQEIMMEETEAGSGSQDEINNGGTPNGEVCGMGVCLRSQPNHSSSILALMYEGQIVIIDETHSTVNSSGGWYYVKHVKSGKWGYAPANCIVCWDAF